MNRIHFWTYITTQSLISHEPTFFSGSCLYYGLHFNFLLSSRPHILANLSNILPSKDFKWFKEGSLMKLREYYWFSGLGMWCFSVELSVRLCFAGNGDEGVLMMVPLCRDHQFFSVKVQIVNILVFMGPVVSVIIQFCPKQPESSRWQYVNKWTGVCSNKTVFTRMDSWSLLFVKRQKSWLNKSLTEQS